MTEYLKQIAEAWGDRIRSPILGSILIFFTLTNWQALYYLFFAGKPVRARLLYFDANTDNLSLYGIPLFAGLVSAIAVPWVKFIGAWISSGPSRRLRHLEHDEGQAFRIYKLNADATESEAKARLEEANERRKIDAAQRLKEAGELGSELEEDLVANRQLVNTGEEEEEEEEEVPNEHENRQLDLIDFAANSGGGQVIIYGDPHPPRITSSAGEELLGIEDSHRKLVGMLHAVDQAMTNGFLKRTAQFDGKTTLEITVKGYDFLGKSSK